MHVFSSLHRSFHCPYNWSLTKVFLIRYVWSRHGRTSNFFTNRDSDSNKWLDAVWLLCRDTPLLRGQRCPSAQYRSRSTLDSKPSTSPFDTLGTCKQASKMAPWWGGPRACLCFHPILRQNSIFIFASYTPSGHLHFCCSRWSSCHRPSKKIHYWNLWNSVLFCKCSIDLLIKW